GGVDHHLRLDLPAQIYLVGLAGLLHVRVDVDARHLGDGLRGEAGGRIQRVAREAGQAVVGGEVAAAERQGQVGADVPSQLAEQGEVAVDPVEVLVEAIVACGRHREEALRRAAEAGDDVVGGR